MKKKRETVELVKTSRNRLDPEVITLPPRRPVILSF
jgi:hypothetical protein